MSDKQLKEFEAHLKAIQQAAAIDYTETIADKRTRISKLLSNYKLFFEYYFSHYAKVECANFHITLANRVKKNKEFKGVFEAFRGAAKSVHTNIGIPLWLKFNEELKCMLLVGATEKAAIRLLASVKAELAVNPRLISDFGQQVLPGSWEDGEFSTKDGCAFFALGLGQSPRGIRNSSSRPDYICVDDADTKKRCKNPQLVREAIEWIEDDLIPAMDIGIKRFVLSNNRISKTSILSGLVQKYVTEKPNFAKWFHLKVNAVDDKGRSTWSAKYSDEYWANEKAAKTLRSWEKEYMNNPVEEGTIFKAEWIKYCKILPLRQYDLVVVYIDPSFKDTATSDFKAVKMWGRKGRELHLLSSFVRQCSIATMVAHCYDLAATVPSDVNVNFYMEANFLQDLILDEFDVEGDSRGSYLNIIPDKRKKPDKYSRIEATSVLYERGFVFYDIEKKDDPDFVRSIEQLLSIEPGYSTPDDSPDADEGAMNILQNGFRTTRHSPIIGARTYPYNNY